MHQHNENDWATKRDTFEHSYEQVLAALKHQDDKIGRSLTALAFITAAGVALFTQVGRSVPLRYDGQSMTVPTFFFVVFLLSAVLALGFMLAAIGPSTPYRRTSRGPRTPSLLFYAAIRSDDEWQRQIEKSASDLTEQLARNFHKEAGTIAKRVHYKIARSREAGAFLNMTFTALSMLGIFSISSISADTRWWIGGSTLVVLTGLPLWDLWQMRRFDFPEGHPSLWAYLALFVGVVLGAVLVDLAHTRDFHWPTLGYMIALLVASRYGLVTRTFAWTFLPSMALAGVVLVILAL